MTIPQRQGREEARWKPNKKAAALGRERAPPRHKQPREEGRAIQELLRAVSSLVGDFAQRRTVDAQIGQVAVRQAVQFAQS